MPKEITQASLRRAHAEHALRQRRDRATALRDQAREASTRGDAAGALLLLRQALSFVPDDEALQAEVASLESARSSATYDRYATAAKIHERDKRWDAAAAAWMKALGERPKDFAANMGVARASCEALLDMSTAADHARRATQIDPRSADAHALLGRVFFLAGRLASARAAVAAALKVDSRHEEARELARKVKLET